MSIPVPHKVDLLIEIEGLLFNGEDDSLEKVIPLIEKLKNRVLISNLVVAIGETKPFEYEKFGKFCLKLKENGLLCQKEKFLKNPFFTFSCFADYLIKIGVFNKDQMDLSIHFDKTIEEFTQPLKKNPLATAIFNDDVYEVNKISRTKNLEQEVISFMDDEHISPMAFAVFCGAENVTNYLIKNFYEIDDDVIDYAIKGGNDDIIQKLASMDASFDNQLENAIQYHHNQLVHWLIKNYKSTEHITLEMCAEMFDTELLIYFMSEGHNVDETGSHKMSALHRAVLMNNTPLARFLIERGADKNILDDHKLKPIDMVLTERMKGLLEDDKKDKE